MKEDIVELKRLFYSNSLTQYGKRKFIGYYEQRIKELEEENKYFKDFYMNCGHEDIAKNITATKYVSIKRQGYLEGYAERDKLSREICEDCIKTEKNRTYIPVSLVEETIEELGNMTLLTVAQKQEVSYAIAVLQELLEKR